MSTYRPHIRLMLLALLAAMACWARADLAPTATPAAGEVTLAIGLSDIERTGASAQSVRKGSTILPGDTIRTRDNGHVHIRFIDGARVSIRPNSLFTVHEYQYNPQNPATNVLRMTLAQGEARAISGDAAQSAKDRFRLNTPLVAIGVKGTDFVTRASADATRVTVNEGAIVMAPFDNQCRVDGLGYCVGQRARELSSAMTGLALEYRSGTVDPGFQIVPGKKDSGKLLPADPAIRENADRLNQNSKEGSKPEDLAAANSRLVWGRWATTPVPGDKMTISFRQALSGNQVTVGDGYYFLFRDKTSPNLLQGLRDKVDFRLTDSAASYRNNAGEIQAATVSNATLGVDFTKSEFSTRLQVGTAGQPLQNLQYGGTIDPRTGVFLGSDNTSERSVSGALSHNGQQAGYVFKAPLGFGSLSGATHWAR